MTDLPKVVLIGRSNVGKSTLFNRLVGKKLALTSEAAGTTRDTTLASVAWRDYEFILVDTGGLDIPDSDEISKGIIRRAHEAVKKADACIFVLDTGVGIVDSERTFARLLNQWKKPVVIAANKCDRPSLFKKAKEFVRLGFGPAVACSAKNGSGTGDLLDELIKLLPANLQPPTDNSQPTTQNSEFITQNSTSAPLTIALVGKPNAGKSSLLNALAGYERSLVSAIPHTTRDVQKEHFSWRRHDITFLDTAGLRRQKQARTEYEAGAVKQLQDYLPTVDVAWLLIESQIPITDQDQRLLRMLQDAGSSIIILFTKRDLLDMNDAELPARENYLRRLLPHAHYIPAVFLSVTKNFEPNKLLELSLAIKNNRGLKIPSELLASCLKSLQIEAKKTARKPHPIALPIKLEQVRTNPPRVSLTILGQFPYPAAMLTLLEKKIRGAIDFTGTPIRFIINRQLGKK